MEEIDPLEELLREAKEQAPKVGRPKVYQDHESMAKYVCWYCGAKAREADHYPPSTAQKFYEHIPPVKVRSCRDCNSRLSNSMQDSLQDRKKVVLILRQLGQYLAPTDEEGFWKRKLLSSIKFTE